LDQAKPAVLNSLASADAQRGYRHAIDISAKPAHGFATPREGNWNKMQFLLGHISIQTTERYLGCKQRIQGAANDKVGIEPPG
jgi:hypothetical protein